MESHLDRILARIAFLLTTNFSSPPPSPVTQPRYCTVKGAKETESAWILFVQDDITGQSLVIKVLRPINDSRYGNMRDISRRHECQLEALHWNTLFTPDIYIGLASVLGLDSAQRRLILGEIIEQVAQSERLVVGAEYGLVMHPLPQNRQLDHLLKKTNAETYQDYTQRVNELLPVLNQQLEYLHSHKTVPGNKMELELKGQIGEQRQKLVYGSSEQVQKKLVNNLNDIDAILKHISRSQYAPSYAHWKYVLDKIREKLPRIIAHEIYQHYFERRMLEQRVRRCHGDLKASNIWIVSSNPRSDSQSEQKVYFLDTIDFNFEYCNIDVLSDFAMLAVDIQAFVPQFNVVQSFIEHYLEISEQQDLVVQNLLAYYLVEKALVRAIVSIVYEHNMEYGLRLLQVAEIRMHNLLRLVDI